MGWGEQIHEIANRLPETRQTLLFSATLPKVLVEFAKAGLSDPVLIRLDVESKLPDELTLSFITCRPEEKLAVLLSLLRYVIGEKSQTVVFAATMHHVEYIHMVIIFKINNSINYREINEILIFIIHITDIRSCKYHQYFYLFEFRCHST